MRQSLDVLQKRTEESVKFRGHILKWTSPHHGESSSLQNATCIHCPAWVQIDSNPQPNGIDVGGPAVALNCPADCEPII